MIPINPSESDFRGPYNKLLSISFPPDSQYTVVPHFMPDSCESAEFLVLYEVLLEDSPVFILELKPPGDLRYYGSKRQDADLQIRRRIMNLRRWSLSLICLGTVLYNCLQLYNRLPSARSS